jgi:phage repressor protein C with HTH and peptisase S24 domain
MISSQDTTPKPVAAQDNSSKTSSKKPNKKTYGRRELTYEEKQEARRLKALWVTYKGNQELKHKSITQKEAAAKVGLKTQGAFSQYLNGIIPLNTDTILAFAEFLGISPALIRPSMSKYKTLGLPQVEIKALPEAGQRQAPWPVESQIEGQTKSLTGNGQPAQNTIQEPQPATFNPPMLRQVANTSEDKVSLATTHPYRVEDTYTAPGADAADEASGIAGSDHVKTITAGVPVSVVEKKQYLVKDIRLIEITDGSLAPVLPEKTIVAISLSDTMIRNGKLYAVDYNGFLLVRAVYETPNGIKLTTYNGENDEHIPMENRHQIKVLGKVFWWQVSDI